MENSEETREMLSDWLRDAHAMEQQGEQLLSSFAGRLDHYPELKIHINNHIHVTQNQQELIKSCLDQEGESISRVKDLSAKILGLSQTLSGVFMSDEVVKGAMSIYVFKQLEVSSYTVLVTAAKILGNRRVQAACEQILNEERAMASWLEEYLPEVTHIFLARSAVDQPTAKR